MKFLIALGWIFSSASWANPTFEEVSLKLLNKKQNQRILGLDAGITARFVFASETPSKVIFVYSIEYKGDGEPLSTEWMPVLVNLNNETIQALEYKEGGQVGDMDLLGIRLKAIKGLSLKDAEALELNYVRHLVKDFHARGESFNKYARDYIRNPHNLEENKWAFRQVIEERAK